jgi:hypothetical protein
LGVRGGEAAVGGDDDDEGCSKRFVASFSPLRCSWKRSGTSPTGFLDPATGIPPLKSKLGRTDLGGRLERMRPEGARDGGHNEGGEERWERRGHLRGGRGVSQFVMIWS